MSPKQVDKASARLRELLQADENAKDDEDFKVRDARRKETMVVALDLALGAAHNLAVLASK